MENLNLGAIQNIIQFQIKLVKQNFNFFSFCLNKYLQKISKISISQDRFLQIMKTKSSGSHAFKTIGHKNNEDLIKIKKNTWSKDSVQ